LFQLNSKLWLTFLARLQHGYHDPSKAMAYVKAYEKDWLKYDVTF